MDTVSGVGFTEFDVRRVIPGDVESVRRRLAGVLEEFNFRVLDEQPLQARRSQLRNIFAANMLEINTKLAVGLKQLGPQATLATFDYTVPQLWTQGDRQTFEREVDAIIALAFARTQATVCGACGAEGTSDSRFCRSCGAPAAREELPAELEVMRLTAGARGAHQEIVTGVVVTLLSLAAMLPLILLGKPKLVNLGWVFLTIGQLIGWFLTLYGMRRLHRTLNPKPSARRESRADVPRAFAPARTAALPPASTAWAAPPVTEGTTELLGVPRETRPAAPAEREPKVTDRSI